MHARIRSDLPPRLRRARQRACGLARWALAGLLALATLAGGPARAADAGPGGPVLVVTSGTSNQGAYIAEILRAEGLNLFGVVDIASVNAAMLASVDVVILARMPLPAARVADLTTWVTAGGNLIAFQPDAQLAPLLGLTGQGAQLANAYLLPDPGTRFGNGIARTTLQYHGAADLYTPSNAAALATLYSDAVTPTAWPAVTLRKVGSGNAAAFTFDLASSVVWTRQGNPAWAASERDGFAPVRSDDKFYGNAAADPQTDWVDPARIGVPQADEQQRLLANLVTLLDASRRPLPRFWYLPQGRKAVVVMTGDDHGNGGTAGRFDKYLAASIPGCAVDQWQCVRSTSYVYAGTPIGYSMQAAYDAQGFEIALHIDTGCADFTPASLEQMYVQQVADWNASFPNLPPPVTQRHHCVVWSDWISGAQSELAHGIRLDTTYYAWPPSWINDVPGYMTGSAMPMRFSTLDGNPVDVYMAATQMTDESGQTFPKTVDTLLDNAIGLNAYYGVFTVNAHTDTPASDVSDAVIASAQARGVAVVSARQMLKWLDGRNTSSFGNVTWGGGVLGFTVVPGAGSTGLQAMLPIASNGLVLGGVTRAGSAVPYAVATVKGIDYAMFTADTGGRFGAQYAADTTAPAVVATTPAASATDVAGTSAVMLQFSEAMDPASINAATLVLRNAGNAIVPATVAYDAASRTATLQPTAALAGSTTYTVSGAARDLAGNPVAPLTWRFTTAFVAAPPACPCSIWPATAAPATDDANDSGSVELGVRFTSDVAGYVTGVRFYKGSANTGAHQANLWTAAGQHLAGAAFGAETASGWQTASFAQPVAIAANTAYVASYLAPAGGYAADQGFFASAGVDAAPLHLLRDGQSGGNGVYAYAGGSTFPANTYLSTNYWVDVVFVLTVPPDTTPPTVSARSPASAGTNIGSPLTATFSEPVDRASVSASTFELHDAAASLVPSTVSYAPESRLAVLLPQSPLAAASTYTARVRGGTAEPHIKDMAGNALAADATWSFSTETPAGACAAPANAIVRENCLAGTPASRWDLATADAGDPSIVGFATQISAARGDTLTFKVSTAASAYRIDIYRLGYYAGSGARQWAAILPSATLPQAQPDCLNDVATGLIDCGNWAPSASWTVPANAVSGIYVAKLVRADGGGASHVVFIVRDDAGGSALVVQTSDTTWQAYNAYLGQDLYAGVPGVNPARAYKVSYNRPFVTRGVDDGQDWLFNAETPMLRFLERNGYDLSYVAAADVDRSAALVSSHKIFLSVGHDEYWSSAQRANVTAARDAGVHLAFFSGNEIFWKTRWEASIDGSGAPYRTLVCYKETHANAKIDPTPSWTGSWRDPRFSPPADGGRPENALSGELSSVNDGATTALVVPAADGKMRLWRNTSLATLAAGASATLPDGTLGYEWDVTPDNGVQPAGLVPMSTTTVTGAPVLQDYGSTYASRTAVHHLAFYKAASGARVFGAGTVQWPWGLDAAHDRTVTPTDVRMQQATINLLADMGVQPTTLMPGLVAATASTDVTAPTSTITSPASGATLQVGLAATVQGSVTDVGGAVGAVEASVDGGVTWHPASGRTTWTYSWTPQATGAPTLRSRAVDDSGNLETPKAGVAVTVVADVTPPLVTAMSPAAGATNVIVTGSLVVTFSEAMAPSSLSVATVVLQAGTTTVAGTLTYNATTHLATLKPTRSLAAGTLYTATVKGGSSGVRDLAGNAMAADRVWTWRTR
jgi:hypothetical protein